jgi:hypothetical protein
LLGRDRAEGEGEMTGSRSFFARRSLREPK